MQYQLHLVIAERHRPVLRKNATNQRLLSGFNGNQGLYLHTSSLCQALIDG
jgi:hypothetical protein